MELRKAGHYYPINNRSGVYCMLRNNERHQVDILVCRRGIGAYTNTDLIYLQQRSHQNDKITSISPTNSPHTTHTPFHSGNGGTDISYSKRDPENGESYRPFDETVTNDEYEEMDEREFLRLIKQWLAE